MKKYLNIIKERWNSSKDKKLFLFWILLRIKKSFQINFHDQAIENDLKVDIVIPTVSKDYEMLEIYLKALKENINHQINKVFVVSQNSEEIINFCNKHNLIFVDERSVLGYGLEKIDYTVNGIDRRGWLFQQLLKLSGNKFVEMENYIIVDSDTILINKHNFWEDGKFVLLENEEWNQPYFDSFENIFSYKYKNKYSFTSHMMIFNLEKLALMKKEIEDKHSKKWDEVYISIIDKTKQSGISDYETYGDWLLYNYPEETKSKPLYNKSFHRSKIRQIEDLAREYESKLKSLSFHNYTKE